MENIRIFYFRTLLWLGRCSLVIMLLTKPTEATSAQKDMIYNDILGAIILTAATKI
jgi:hypothetical protein